MKHILHILIILCAVQGFSQSDMIRSQRIHDPVSFNPANAGLFNGSFRGIGYFRRQWENISVGTPYQTYGLSTDFALSRDVLGSSDMFGMGVTIMSDQAGTSQFEQLGANVAFSYIRPMDGAKRNWISLGFQAGYAQKSLVTEGLNWGDTWGTTGWDPNLTTQEVVTNESSNYLDFAGGINFFHSAKSGTKAFLGWSTYHIGEPTVNFLGTDDIISMHHIASGGVLFGNKRDEIFFYPNFIANIQNPVVAVTYGMDIRFVLGQATRHTGYLTETSFALGLYNRWNDALIPSVRIQKGGFELGISYDITIGNLTRINGGQSGPEFMLTYRTGYKKGSRNTSKQVDSDFM